MHVGPQSLLIRPFAVGEAARRMAEDLVRRHGDAVAAILFHGSCLRDETGAGILDFYVLVDDYRAFHRRAFPTLANILLPPSVAFLPGPPQGPAGAKVAVISRKDFIGRLALGGLDTTLWARFCQPAALVHSRDDEAAAWVAAALEHATATAVSWAIRLGPEQGTAEDFWTELFRHTYKAELRVEGPERAKQLYGFAAPHFDAAFANLAPPEIVERLAEGRYRVHLDAAERRQARWRWRVRQLAGKSLNVARLVKALFTFAGGVDYIVGKLERHSGQRIELRPWQRRHPLLAAPGIMWSLYRRGVIR